MKLLTAFRRPGDAHHRELLIARRELLCGPMREAAWQRIGHTQPGRDCPSCPASRAEHDSWGCHRTGCPVPVWRLVPVVVR